MPGGPAMTESTSREIIPESVPWNVMEFASRDISGLRSFPGFAEETQSLWKIRTAGAGGKSGQSESTAQQLALSYMSRADQVVRLSPSCPTTYISIGSRYSRANVPGFSKPRLFISFRPSPQDNFIIQTLVEDVRICLGHRF
jgi:hypothetical protein